MSWKYSLKLPKSQFASRPSLPQLKQLLPNCTDGFYEWQANDRPAENPFILHDGPPYANGPLHIGHALNKVLKDMILRWQVQRGRRVVYRPSWDCHGLPIEMKALKSKNSRSMKPAEVRAKAKSLATKTIAQQMATFRSFGVAADWDNKWTTMDADFEIRQLRIFQRLVRRGLIYRKFKPVYWSPSSVTALAEAELDYREDHESTSAYVKFPITSDLSHSPSLSKLEGPLYAAIWTTTPWTLPANKAIGFHDEIPYSVLRVGDYNIIVAKSRVETVQKFLPDAEVVVDSLSGAELKGLEYRNKLRGKASTAQPLLHADFVTTDSGTGLVHMAPGHGQVDYEACSAVGIEAFAPINDEGFFTNEAYPDDPEALTSAPSILDNGGQAVLDLVGDDVLRVHKIRHKYPYDWRTQRPVVVRATAQWFADVGSVKEAAIEALKDVRFVPETGRARLESFIKGRSEWCISRQRSWGVPIPALYDDSGKAIMTTESIDHIISVIRERGMEAWFTDSPDEPAWIPPFLEGSYRRGTDTMDVWFDSGSSWSEISRPADLYLEGSDQHRGWFQSSLLTYVAAMDEDTPKAPFRTLITHGFVLDAEGRKMSKSIGNTVSPESVMDGTLLAPRSQKSSKTTEAEEDEFRRVMQDESDEVKEDGQDEPAKTDKKKFRTRHDKPVAKQVELGPDNLRLWAASNDFTSDVQIGAPMLYPVQNSLLRYRTMLKMILGSIHFPQDHHPRITKLDVIARIQLEDVMAQVGRAYDNQEFQKGISLINQWLSTDLSAFYLEALKDRLYCGDGGGFMIPIYQGFLRMLAPITPLLVEEAIQHTPEWLTLDLEWRNPAREIYDHKLMLKDGRWDRARVREDMPKLFTIHSAVKLALERARGAKVVGSSLQGGVIIKTDDADVISFLESWSDELDTIFVVSSTQVNAPLPDDQHWDFVEEFDIQGKKGTVHIVPPKKAKCPRCWRYKASEPDTLCHRCNKQVKGGFTVAEDTAEVMREMRRRKLAED